MRTHALVSATTLSLGLALAAPAVFAQNGAEGGAVRRWPTAADGGRVSGGNRITADQGPLEQRRSPGGSGGGGAVRGGGVRGGDGGGRVAVPRGSGGGGGRVVYPGGGRRTVVVRPGYGYGYYPRYYYPYSSFYYGAGYFDTFGYWGAGWGTGFGYAAYPYGGYAYPGYAYPGYASSGYGYSGYNTGRVRLEVEPRDAEVFIDGYYSGLVDDFDGRLQGLTLETGGYSVEIRKQGWETLTFDVRVTPGRTTHYKGQLIPQNP